MSKDSIMYTTLSNIKKYINLHFPNKYWSISISMPSTSSWDTFRTAVYHQWVYSSSFLLPILCFSLKIIFSCYTYFNHPLMITPYHKTCFLICAQTYVNSKQISLAAHVQHNPRHETMFQMQTHNWDNVTVRYTDSTNCSCYHITVIDLNVRVCCEVMICVTVMGMLCWDDKPKNKWIQTFHSHADRNLYNNSLTAKKFSFV